MKQLFYTLVIALSLYTGSAFAADSLTDPAKQLAATEAAVKEVSVSEVSVKQVQQFLKTKTANVVILDPTMTVRVALRVLCQAQFC